jgi:hypothetical protein
VTNAKRAYNRRIPPTLETPALGQHWVSRDPRDNGRTVEVLFSDDANFVKLKNIVDGRCSRISAARFLKNYSRTA